MLLHEDIDLAFIRDSGAIEPEFKKIPFTTDRLVAVLPLDHPLAECDTVEIDDLIDENFLMLPQGSFVSESSFPFVAKLDLAHVLRSPANEPRTSSLLSHAAPASHSSCASRRNRSPAEGSPGAARPATTSEVRLYLKRNAAHSQAVVSFIGFLPYRQLLQGDRASSTAARPS